MRTDDIGGQATTTEFMKCVINEIQLLTPEIGLFRANGHLNYLEQFKDYFSIIDQLNQVKLLFSNKGLTKKVIKN